MGQLVFYKHKTSYNTGLHMSERFLTFLESFRGVGSDDLLDVVGDGYRMIMQESFGERYSEMKHNVGRALRNAVGRGDDSLLAQRSHPKYAKLDEARQEGVLHGMRVSDLSPEERAAAMRDLPRHMDNLFRKSIYKDELSNIFRESFEWELARNDRANQRRAIR